MGDAESLKLAELNLVCGKHLRRKQVAEMLGLSLRLLDRLAAEKSGPPFFLVGRIPLYPEAALDAWIHAQMTKC